MHVTPSYNKQTSVISDRTCELQIFIGPIYIHDNSDVGGYSNFFNHFNTKLADTDSSEACHWDVKYKRTDAPSLWHQQ